MVDDPQHRDGLGIDAADRHGPVWHAVFDLLAAVLSSRESEAPKKEGPRHAPRAFCCEHVARIDAAGVDHGDMENVMATNNPENNPNPPSSDAKLSPGDEAPRGTPGTGEDVCPDCQGSGRIDNAPCPTCAGRGTIVRGVGGG
jgi:hypothetical protein